MEKKRVKVIYEMTQKYLKKFFEVKGNQNFKIELLQKIAEKPQVDLDNNLFKILDQKDKDSVNEFMGSEQ